MSKLLKLKERLTVPDAARHLSILFEEEVSEADVLRLALDSHLMLSVLFVGEAYACLGTIIKTPERISSEALVDPNMVQIKTYEVLKHNGSVDTIHGVWDLTMLGAEKDYVEREWQRLTSGPEAIMKAKRAIYLCRDNGSACVLLSYVGDTEPDPWNDAPTDYEPANTLPLGAHLVVRAVELEKLEKRISSLNPHQGAKEAPPTAENAELRKRIEAVLDYARNRCDPKLSHTKLAEHIVEQHKSQGFSESAVRQILGGRYRPMKQFNLDGLN